MLSGKQKIIVLSKQSNKRDSKIFQKISHWLHNIHHSQNSLNYENMFNLDNVSKNRIIIKYNVEQLRQHKQIPQIVYENFYIEIIYT